MTTSRQIDASLSHSILDESEESNLTPRDTGVLQTVMGEGLMVFTFDGLKRLTGLHQEKLSRIIDRLEEEGLLEKVDECWQVSPAVTAAHQLLARVSGLYGTPTRRRQHLARQIAYCPSMDFA